MGNGACEHDGFLRAAQYLRMSTEHQQYSIANQATAISLYAAAHQLLIVRSFIDPGKSGLTIKRRQALQDLIHCVQSGQADFECILVYDVSRWGRFQDLDEAAHYEYICRSTGINVRYCAEQFENDNSMLSGLLKAMKRMMAGEYSRELSVKASAAHERLARIGFAQGAPAIYGLRRQLIDSTGTPKQLLKQREFKAIHTDRVIYIPGPADETVIVREIFDRFTKGEHLEHIAERLNEAGVRPQSGDTWNHHTIRRLLRNEKYMGTYIYARTSKKMNGRLTKNEPEKWIVNKDAIPPIVSAVQFGNAQARLDALTRRYTKDSLLDHLRQLLEKNGILTAKIINRCKPGPTAATYSRWFGDLQQAFSLVGFKHARDYSSEAGLRRRLRAIRLRWQNRIIEQLQQRGVQVSMRNKPDIITLNQEVRLGLRLLKYQCWRTQRLRPGWHFDISFKKGIQILVLACLDNKNETVQSQYIVPKLTQMQGFYWCSVGRSRVFLEACRSDTLQPLFDSALRTRIQLFGMQ